MNSLILTVFTYLAVSQTGILAEQLFHREGRFIDLTLHRYKTQLPSIHDIANTFIHYRMPVAVFVPTVRLNLRQRQKRTHFANFPSTPKSVLNQSDVSTNNKVTKAVDTETTDKSNKDSPQTIISRHGWTARSLSKPKSFNSLANYNYKIRSRSNGPIYQSLNYATQLPSESNVDLMPFLYKEHLPSQSSGLFNSPYQLTNSNPGQMFSQNIAYIQPNSLAPFQPNILLLTTPERSVISDAKKVEKIQSVVNDLQKNITQSGIMSIESNANNSTSTVVRSGTTASETASNITAFDVNQVGDNPDEIVEEHVQNHEPVENVPVSPVEEQPVVVNGSESAKNSTTISSEIVAVNNSTTSIEQPRIGDRDKSQLEVIQPIALPIVTNQAIEMKNSDLVNKLTIVDPYRNNNIVKRLYSYPISPISSNQLKTKNALVITGRTHRSLPIDMPSYAGLLTAAVAQSVHSRDNRRKSFTRFLNDNLN